MLLITSQQVLRIAFSGRSIYTLSCEPSRELEICISKCPEERYSDGDIPQHKARERPRSEECALRFQKFPYLSLLLLPWLPQVSSAFVP
jgi:hypothetical protein